MHSFHQHFKNTQKHFEGVLEHAKNYEYEIKVGICVVVAVYLISTVVRYLRSNFPPGPIGLPIVGYLPFLTENTHLDLIELGKKYGDVFSLRLGSENVVILHGIEAIKEAFGKPEFLGRPPEGPLKLLNGDSAFFATDDIHKWKEQRRFVLHSMRDLGLGKSKIEGEVQEEIQSVLEILSKSKGQPIDVKQPLSSSMSNNISALVFGKRLAYDDPDRRLLDKNLDDGNEATTQTSSYAFFPWLRYVPFFTKFLNIDQAMHSFNIIRGFFRKEIKKHRDTLDPKNVRDFIDSYHVEMDSRKRKGENTHFTDEMLMCNVMDLFGAGSETVRTSILWCIYTLAAFPDVQVKIYNEILDVIGPDRNPDFQDLKNMPFTHAVIMEIMRWKTIVPLNLMRFTVADATVGGYTIPKGTMVMANFWNAHHDPRNWTEPDTFKPERFLSPDGNSVVKSNNYMAFSLGKRACPGETMAYMEVFLYFTSMIQRFDIKFPNGFKPNFQGKLNVTYRMDPYKVRFLLRK